MEEPKRNGGLSVKNIYGYVRVNTKEQNEDRQLIAMKEMGVPGKNRKTENRARSTRNRRTLPYVPDRSARVKN